MKTIPLGGKKAAGRVAVVDDEDYELAASRRWYAVEGDRTTYAQASVRRPDGRRGTIKMHNLIMGIMGVDHVNHDGLDNQRANLRPATRFENARNTRKSASSRSRYKGVRAMRPAGGSVRYEARITADGRPLHIGTFFSEQDAAIAYDIYARRLFGEFACLNFPERQDEEVPQRASAATPLPAEMIITLRAAGQSFAQIAAALGTSTTCVFRRYHAIAGTTPAPGHRPDVSDEEILRLREAGHAWEEVGRRVGLSSTAARARYFRFTGKRPRAYTSRRASGIAA